MRSVWPVVWVAVAALAVGCSEHSGNDDEDDPVTCQDLVDNDHDGFVDCEDPDCTPLAVCISPDGDADSDVDGDGDADEDDGGEPDGDAPSCAEGCDDGVDCTVDECVDGACEHRADDALCDDEDDCTTDRCERRSGCVNVERDEDGDGHVAESCGGDDCDDTDRLVHPGAFETAEEVLCDGVDQDCDGAADDGLCCVGLDDDARLTDAASRSEAPTVAFTGTGYGFAFQDDRDGTTRVYLGLADGDLARVGTDQLMSSDAAAATGPQLAWSETASLFALAWSEARPAGDGTDAYLRFAGADGTPSGAATRLTDSAQATTVLDVVWNGTDFALLVHEAPETPATATLTLERRSTAGALLGSVPAVTTGDPGADGDLVWTGTEYAVVYTDWDEGSAEVRLATVAADLASGSAPVTVNATTIAARDVTAAWTGSAVAVAWSDRRDDNNEIYFNVFAGGTTTCPADLRVTDDREASGSPSLLGHDGAATLVWRDRRASRFDVLAIGLDVATCATTTAEAEVSWGDPFTPVVVAGASGPAVFWSDGRFVPRYEVLANRIGCAATLP